MDEIFGRNFLGEMFLEDFFGRIFLGGFFWGGFFWEEFFGRNLVHFYKELMFLSKFWGSFVSMHKEGRNEEEFLTLKSAKSSSHSALKNWSRPFFGRKVF